MEFTDAEGADAALNELTYNACKRLVLIQDIFRHLMHVNVRAKREKFNPKPRN